MAAEAYYWQASRVLTGSGVGRSTEELVRMYPVPIQLCKRNLFVLDRSSTAMATFSPKGNKVRIKYVGEFAGVPVHLWTGFAIVYCKRTRGEVSAGY